MTASKSVTEVIYMTLCVWLNQLLNYTMMNKIAETKKLMLANDNYKMKHKQ